MKEIKLEDRVHPTIYIHNITEASFSIEPRIDDPKKQNISIEYRTENGDKGNICLFFLNQAKSNVGDLGLLKKIKGKVVSWVKITRKG